MKKISRTLKDFIIIESIIFAIVIIIELFIFRSKIDIIVLNISDFIDMIVYHLLLVFLVSGGFLFMILLMAQQPEIAFKTKNFIIIEIIILVIALIGYLMYNFWFYYRPDILLIYCSFLKDLFDGYCSTRFWNGIGKTLFYVFRFLFVYYAFIFLFYKTYKAIRKKFKKD